MFFRDRLVFFDLPSPGDQQKKIFPVLRRQRLNGAIDTLDAELGSHLDQKECVLRDMELFADRLTDRGNILRSAAGGIDPGRQDCKTFILCMIKLLIILFLLLNQRHDMRLGSRFKNRLLQRQKSPVAWQQFQCQGAVLFRPVGGEAVIRGKIEITTG